MFYLKCSNLLERTELIKHLAQKNIKATFHYSSLHSSEFFKSKHDGRVLTESDCWSDCLIRLPMYADLSERDVDYICETVCNFYNV